MPYWPLRSIGANGPCLIMAVRLQNRMWLIPTARNAGICRLGRARGMILNLLRTASHTNHTGARMASAPSLHRRT